MKCNKKTSVLFALLVMIMFILSPVCYAQSIAQQAYAGSVAESSVSEQENAGIEPSYSSIAFVSSVAQQADESGLVPAYSRRDAIAASSFTRPLPDPLVENNLRKQGIIPPPPAPVSVQTPVPVVPDILNIRNNRNRSLN